MISWVRSLAVALALLAGAATLWGAANPEEKAFNSATLAFQNEFWARAEREFATFLERYPQSENRAVALLCQAEARYQLKNYRGAAALLETGRATAGKLGDEYAFWLAQTHQKEGRPGEAAELFAQLSREFPESPRALEAILQEATIRTQLKQWPRVAELLQNPESKFQKATAANSAAGFGLRGRMLLASGLFEQGQFAAAEQAMAALVPAKLEGVSAWERDHLLARILMAEGRLDAALASATNLPTTVTNKPGLIAEGWAMNGRILERLNRASEAVQAWQKLLAVPDAPAEAQREALLHSSNLLLAQGRVGESLRTLENFLAAATNSVAADVAWLAVGELRLRQSSEAAATNNASATNLLARAQAAFDTLLEKFPQSALRGRAQLGRGWGLWMENRFEAAGEAFASAAGTLEPSYEQAVANFKLADAQAKQNNFPGALASYQKVVASGNALPAVHSNLVEQALYQILRVAGEAKDEPAATAAMEQLLREFPEGGLAEAGLLAFSATTPKEASPAARRKVLADFLERLPDSKLTPAVRLAMARTYEQSRDWPHAIEQYTELLTTAPEPALQARAEYYRALAVWHTGDETNALTSFTNFVARYPTNDLAPLAQWWIAHHYWQEEDFKSAEGQYQLLAEKYPKSPLRYEAMMMGGRAAIQRGRPEEALSYFTNLTSDPLCPANFQAQALFASGDAFMDIAKSAGETNQPAQANYREAARRFSAVAENYTNLPIAWDAVGKLGECYFQLGAVEPAQYEYASNALARVLDSSAGATTRSAAECLLAMVGEKQSQLETLPSSAGLLQQAMDHYLNVVCGTHLREGETADPFWVRFAGLKALNLAEARRSWPQVIKLCDTLSEALPTLKPQLEKKRARAEEEAAKTAN